MSAETNCIFCKIVDRHMSAHIVCEDEHTLTVLDHRPLLHGHCLVMPKPHAETLMDLPDDAVGALFLRVKRIARALQDALQSDGSFIAVNQYVSQTVPHLHVHVVPRWRKDGLFRNVLIWKRAPYESDQQAADLAAKIRAALT